MKLADWMTEAGIDDEALAARVASDRTTISRVRRGVTRPSWGLAAKIKAESGGAVTADEFLPDAAAAD